MKKQQQSARCVRKIANWRSYNEALVNRGSLTIWIEKSVADKWLCSSHHGGRGGGFKCSDLAIETPLMLKVMFKLPLRALEGFINSLFRLSGLPLSLPDYSSSSRRAKTVEIKYCPPAEARLATC